MKRIAIIALAAVVAASGASASVTNPGKAQIAAQLGLDASEYSSTELSLIAKAREDRDHQAEAFYLSHTNRQAPEDSSIVTPGKAQIAAQLGVDATAYSSAELAALSAARTVAAD